MNINTNYDTLVTAYGTTALGQTTIPSDNTIKEGNRDSYIPSVSSSDPLISGTYTSSGTIVGETKSSSDSTNSGGMGSAGGGSDSSDDSTTTTQLVTINGVTYLETTTEENGVTTTTRTVLHQDSSKNDL